MRVPDLQNQRQLVVSGGIGTRGQVFPDSASGYQLRENTYRKASPKQKTVPSSVLAPSNRCIASSNKCLTSSNKKLVETIS